MNTLRRVTVQRRWASLSARRTQCAVVAAGVAVTVLLTTVPAPAAGALGARSARRPLRGLDISAFQHARAPINWRMLARHGMQFVAIKVTEGTYYTNPYYRSDARAAARAGLAVLPYAFANPSKSGGAATAQFAVRAARYRRRSAALPLVVDLENDPYERSDCYRTGVRRMVSWIAAFIARARKLTGKRPIIYTTDDWWRECTRSTSRFRSDPLWVAAWDISRPAVPSPWHRWAFWQYASDALLPGIGRTDLDYYQPVGGFSSLRPEPKHKKARPKKNRKPKHHRKLKKHHRKPKKHHRPKKHRRPKKHHRSKPKKHPRHTIINRQ
jgi:GH25 family lysozyme M1 (1,4-beta-N-acetylmuramidase)